MYFYFSFEKNFLDNVDRDLKKKCCNQNKQVDPVFKVPPAKKFVFQFFPITKIFGQFDNKHHVFFQINNSHQHPCKTASVIEHLNYDQWSGHDTLNDPKIHWKPIFH